MFTQEQRDRVHRILVNIAYLLGEKIAWLCEKWEWLKKVIVSFIEGFTDATLPNVQ